jgi:hypothetical protein
MGHSTIRRMMAHGVDPRPWLEEQELPSYIGLVTTLPIPS